MTQILLPTSSNTHLLGNFLGKYLAPGSVLLLQGDLGAGKTTLVQGLAAGLGITDSVVSPTFTLINEYTEGRIPLYHLDLYRLEPPEVAALNLESYWEGVEVDLGIVAIEWSERLPYLPDSYLQIDLCHQNGENGAHTSSQRLAEITPHNFLICEHICEFLKSLSI
ncbi:tRNA (adenosine(37)-N6)-threonylcarbamoyltransferase complex ATPase subunit type 1 TsaE [Calothrix sp. 336/3]|uniref:tRNA (adenosine(37)-N6)-threonylcarbamoyltransferase complex ATPase subunit type 1 TsaE n=1 Tax=Calothrix sp. 336/3 TaxID=1337936 RepID=UPI0004E43655|nr:tRNA (adenosine(37)-N6)-threonylcarbamoyltransferase complex ATPase subunit type 1 TsaE [Calothrix sp. 336/3]AKG20815.1 ATP-binding protein [Calothrix sp. 336/3]